MSGPYEHVSAEGDPSMDAIVRKPERVVSVREALQTKHFRKNYIASIVICTAINTGLGFGMLKGNDYVGLWTKPNTDDPDNSTIWIDFIITCAALTFFTNLFANPGIRGNVKKGLVTPIRDADLMQGMFRYLPVRFGQGAMRGFLYAIEWEVVFALPLLALLSTICQSGGMHSGFPGDDTCAMRVLPYIFFKGTFAMFLAITAYPIIYCGALNRKNIPDEMYDEFLGRVGTFGDDGVPRTQSGPAQSLEYQAAE